MQPLGILVALPDEGRTLIRGKPDFETIHRLPEGHWLGVSGTGPLRAERLALRLADQGVRGLLSWGCACALHPALKPGQLLLPESIQDETGRQHGVHPTWHRAVHERIGAHVNPITAPLAESSVLLGTPAEKLTLRQRTKAHAADMESAALARVAHERRLALLVIRSVSDDAQAKLPEPVLGALDERGEVALGTLLLGLLRGPSALPDLITLGLGFRKAMNSLRDARTRLPPDFDFRSDTP